MAENEEQPKSLKYWEKIWDKIIFQLNTKKKELLNKSQTFK